MDTDRKQTETTVTCESCGGRFGDGDTVIQIVQDRHPTYDLDIVLSTFHEKCWKRREQQVVECPHCQCAFRLTLLKKGDDFQNLSGELLCPFCGTLFESRMGK